MADRIDLFQQDLYDIVDGLDESIRTFNMFKNDPDHGLDKIRNRLGIEERKVVPAQPPMFSSKQEAQKFVENGNQMTDAQRFADEFALHLLRLGDE